MAIRSVGKSGLATFKGRARLGSGVAAMALALSFAPASFSPAQAQNAPTRPGVDANCPIIMGEAICEDDLGGGIVSGPGDPAFDILIVRNPSGPITPDAGNAGVAVTRDTGDVRVRVEDGVTIAVDNTPDTQAFGILARTSDGLINIESAADITGIGGNAIMEGISAFTPGGTGPITVSNTGTIDVTSAAQRVYGILGQNQMGGDITLSNSAAGTIIARSSSTGERDEGLAALGAFKLTGEGDISITNDGTLRIESTEGNFDTDVPGAASAILINNFGSNSTTRIVTGATSDISTTGTQTNGIFAIANSTTGQSLIDIDTAGTFEIVGESGYAILAQGNGGNVVLDVNNSATISTAVASGGAFLLFASAPQNDLNLINTGAFSGGGTFDYGVRVVDAGAPAGATTSIDIENQGDLDFAASGRAFSLEMGATQNVTASIINSGAIDFTGSTNPFTSAFNVDLSGAPAGQLSISNTGTIMVAEGTIIAATANDVTVDNTGDLSVLGPNFNVLGMDILASGGSGDIQITNSGAITTSTNAPSSIGISAIQRNASGAITIANSGTLSAISGGSGERDLATAGLLAIHETGGGDIEITNEGDINVAAGGFDSDFNGIAGGIVTNSFVGSNTTEIVNSGSITASGDGVYGIVGFVSNDSMSDSASLNIENQTGGAISVDGIANAGILAQSAGTDVNVTVENNAVITMANGSGSSGIRGLIQSGTSSVSVSNEGAISGSGAFLRGIAVTTLGAPVGGNYDALIFNSANITLDTPVALGIGFAATRDDTVIAQIVNNGDLDLSNTTEPGSIGISLNLGLEDTNAGDADGVTQATLFNSGAIMMGAGTAIDVNADTITATNTGAITLGTGTGIRITGSSDLNLTNSGSITTTGADSDGIAINPLRGLFAVELVVDGATVSTGGANSMGLLIDADPTEGGNLTNVTVRDSTIMSGGAGSHAADLRTGGGGSISTLTVENSELTASGSESHGLVFTNSHNGTAISAVFTNATISTTGASNSAALLVQADASYDPLIDGSSVMAVAIGRSSFSTTGTNSAGIEIADLQGASSIVAITVGETDVSTTGDNSDGLTIGTGRSGGANGVSFTSSVGTSTIDTQGDNSRGIVIDGIRNGLVGGDASIAITDNTITTSGDGAHGIELLGTSGSLSNAIIDTVFANTSITTAGDGAHGLVMGGLPAFAANDETSTTLNLGLSEAITTSGAASDAVVIGAGWGTAGAMADDRDNGIASRFAVIEVSDTISATGTDSVGVRTESLINNFEITDTGSITGDTFAILSQGDGGVEMLTNAGTITGGIVLGAEDSTLDNSGTITGDINTGAGDNTLFARAGGTITGNVTMGGGSDTVVAFAGTQIDGDVQTGGGADSVETTGQAITGIINLGDGNDTLFMTNVTGNLRVVGGAGTDILTYATDGADAAVSLDEDVFGGIEQFDKLSSERLTITGNNSGAMVFNLIEGSLFLNGVFGNSTVAVATGTVFGGTGTIGGLTSTGGTIAPGNSIGTLTINGDFTLDANSIFQVEVNDAGNGDLAIVNGVVTLGGATLDVVETGAFAGSDPFNYIIIDNDGADAVNGVFGTIQNDFAFLTPTVSYTGGDGNDVRLTLARNDATPPAEGCALGNGSPAPLVCSADDSNGFKTDESLASITVNSGVNVTSSQTGGSAFEGVIEVQAGSGVLNIAGDVVNNGTISSTGDDFGLLIVADIDGDVRNSASGTINAAASGGVSISGTIAGDFINAGSITGKTGDGAGLGPVSGDFVNDTGATIFGGDRGVEFTNVGGDFINRGQITGGFNGVDVRATSDTIGGDFINEGTITGEREGAVVGAVAGDFRNSGTITGDISGVRVRGDIGTGFDGQFVNTGTITASSGTAVVFHADLTDRFVNSGNIEGAGGTAIQFAEGFGGTLELRAGSNITGLVVADQTLGSDLLVFGGDTDSSFDVSLIDTQYLNFDQLEKIGASTWTLTGTQDAFSAFFGVREGTLLLDNASLAAVQLSAFGARVGGNGTLGGTEILSGSTLAPGLSIGTLTIQGDLLFDATSIFEVEVDDAGNGDLLIVNGVVTLGGATLDVVETGTFAGADPFNYIIIDNDGADAVNGIFGTIQNDFAFLTPTVSYNAGDGNDVALTLTRNNVIPTGGCTPDAANGVNAVCSGVFDEDTPPNGFGDFDITDVTLLIESDAVITPRGAGILLGRGAVITTLAGSRIEPQPDTLANGRDGIAISGVGAVDHAGSITTLDPEAFGIAGRQGEDFAIVVRPTGSIATSGEGAHGILLANLVGDTASIADIVMDGTITTTGNGADGIWVSFPSGNGEAAVEGSITVGGAIGVSGEDASGIWTILGDLASIDIMLMDGAEISASGAGGYGIYLANSGGYGTGDGGGTATTALAQVMISEGAQVIASSDAAIAEGSAVGAQRIDTTLTIAGEVVRSDGGTAIELDSGDDTIILRPTYAVTGGIDGGEGDDAFRLTGASGTQATFDFDANSVDGFESFTKEDGGSWTLIGDGSALGGSFEVLGGLLAVNGDLSGTSFSVAAGSRLSGTGMLGDLASTGGTIAPGNSIGTLSVSGDLTLGDGSVLEIEVNDVGLSDVVAVNGAVSLGGTLRILDMNGGDFAGADPFNYVIITNAGEDAVNGTFAQITNQLAFLTPSVSLTAGDGNDVGLTLTRNDLPPPPTGGEGPLFPTAAQTFNQFQAATALDTFDETPGTDTAEVFNTILFLTNAQAPLAFDATSGEIYASLLAQAGFEGLTRSREIMARARRAGTEGWGIWGGIAGSDGSIDGDGNAAPVDAGSFGFDLGIDYAGPDNGWAVGVAVGLRDGDVDVPGRASQANFENWYVSGYGRYGTGGEGLTISAALTFSQSDDIAVTRAIRIASLSRTAFGLTDTSAFAAGTEARYGLGMGGGWSIGPVASVTTVSADLGNVSEAGAQSLNLTSSGSDESFTVFGGGAFANWQDGSSAFDLSAQYVGGSTSEASSAFVFEGAPGNAITIRAPEARTDGLLTSASGHLELGAGWTIGLQVDGFFGDDFEDVTGSAILGWRF